MSWLKGQRLGGNSLLIRAPAMGTSVSSLLDEQVMTAELKSRKDERETERERKRDQIGFRRVSRG